MLLEVIVAELKGKVEGTIRMEYVLQLNHVLVLERTQSSNFTQCSCWNTVLFTIEAHFLEGYHITALTMPCLVNDAECPLTQPLQLLVLRIRALHTCVLCTVARAR